WPPGEHSLVRGGRALQRLAHWHLAAAAAIRPAVPDLLLGVAKHWIDFVPLDERHKGHVLGARLQDSAFNRYYLDRTVQASDFIGLNYYSRSYATGPVTRMPVRRADDPHTAMGWSIAPDGLLSALRRLAAYQLPILITENGIATDDDSERQSYLLSHLGAVRDALREGVPVVGYQHWSLLDNFEWAEGYWPKFGLVAVDRTTLE
ncbi:glycoside hydrolase family protein, partial [mine drainage metagenome]